MKKLVVNKKILIEIIVAMLIALSEFIWLITKQSLIGWNGEYFERFGIIDMVSNLTIAVNINIWGVIVLQIINSKGEKNNKILVIFIATTLFVAELVAALICRFQYDNMERHEYLNLIKLCVVFVQMNLLFAIVLQILYSDKHKLCKTIVVAVVLTIEVVIVLLCANIPEVYETVVYSDMSWNEFENIIYFAFASLYANIAIALRIVDSIKGKLAVQPN